MTYDPNLLRFGSGSEIFCASKEDIYLTWLNSTNGQWENAINGNIGTNLGDFHLGAWPTGDMTLGDWGVNTSNHTVWAVVNHNGDFAVVPEPSSVLIVMAMSGLSLIRHRRRKLPVT